MPSCKTPLKWLERASLTSHIVAKKLFQLIDEKQSNIALAADVTCQEKLLDLADRVGPSICVLKTHVDILENFTPDFGARLKSLAEKHRFLIFEDRKFADIGNTSAQQFQGGIYRIADWADMINAHIIPGPGIIEGLKKIGLPKQRGLLLLAQMSSSETMAKGVYLKKCVEWAEKHADFVFGFICLEKLSQKPGFIHFTPGVKLETGKDSLGQRYRSVEEILLKNQSDIIIVGRDILENPHPEKQAELYRERAWGCIHKLTQESGIGQEGSPDFSDGASAVSETRPEVSTKNMGQSRRGPNPILGSTCV